MSKIYEATVDISVSVLVGASSKKEVANKINTAIREYLSQQPGDNSLVFHWDTANIKVESGVVE